MYPIEITKHCLWRSDFAMEYMEKNLKNLKSNISGKWAVILPMLYKEEVVDVFFFSKMKLLSH